MDACSEYNKRPTQILYFARSATVAWIIFLFVADIYATASEALSYQGSGKIISVDAISKTITFTYRLPSDKIVVSEQQYIIGQPFFQPGQTVRIALTDTGTFDKANIRGLANFNHGILGLIFLFIWFILGYIADWQAFRIRMLR